MPFIARMMDKLGRKRNVNKPKINSRHFWLLVLGGGLISRSPAAYFVSQWANWARMGRNYALRFGLVAHGLFIFINRQIAFFGELGTEIQASRHL